MPEGNFIKNYLRLNNKLYTLSYVQYVFVLGQFKLVKIKLNGNNVRETVVKVLSACNIPTNYVDKIPVSTVKPEFRYSQKISF